MLHGVTSDQVFATAISGFSRSASVSPVAFSIARAGARLMPFLMESLRMSSVAKRGELPNPLRLASGPSPSGNPRAGPGVGQMGRAPGHGGPQGQGRRPGRRAPKEGPHLVMRAGMGSEPIGSAQEGALHVE